MALASVLELLYYAHGLREGVLYGNNRCKDHIYIEYSQEQATLIVFSRLPASCSSVLSSKDGSTRRCKQVNILVDRVIGHSSAVTNYQSSIRRVCPARHVLLWVLNLPL